MAYSVYTDVQTMMSIFSTAKYNFSTSQITALIAMADIEVNAALSGLYSISAIQAEATVPELVKLLSIYKTCELLMSYSGFPKDTFGRSENYWGTKFNDLIADIREMRTQIILSSGATLGMSITTDQNDDRPAKWAGQDPFGGTQDNEDDSDYIDPLSIGGVP